MTLRRRKQGTCTEDSKGLARGGRRGCLSGSDSKMSVDLDRQRSYNTNKKATSTTRARKGVVWGIASGNPDLTGKQELFAFLFAARLLTLFSKKSQPKQEKRFGFWIGLLPARHGVIHRLSTGKQELFAFAKVIHRVIHRLWITFLRTILI